MLINPRPTLGSVEFWLCANTVLPRDFQDANVGHLEKTLGFVVVSFLSSQLSDMNPRPAPRILWQVRFFPRIFQMRMLGTWKNPRLCGSQLSDINPGPTPRISWNSGFAQIRFFFPPRIFKMRMLGTWKNPRFCSSQLSDKS